MLLCIAKDRNRKGKEKETGAACGCVGSGPFALNE